MQTFKQPQKIFIDRGVLSPAAPLECRQIKLGWMQEGTSRIFGMCSRYLKVVIPCSWDEMWFEMWRCGWCFICKINKNWGRWRHDSFGCAKKRFTCFACEEDGLLIMWIHRHPSSGAALRMMQYGIEEEVDWRRWTSTKTQQPPWKAPRVSCAGIFAGWPQGANILALPRTLHKWIVLPCHF
jgi:hypothetical protein